MNANQNADALSPTKRFSNRVADYVKYRPSYPVALLADLEKIDALPERASVADIGFGTGLLTQLFLERGAVVVGVEPNRDMRKAGEEFLKSYPQFASVDGAAEATTLPTTTFDLVVAGQAFHWFDWAKTKMEFARILRPSGWVALIWNERALQASPFQSGYEALAREFTSDYSHVDHRLITPEVLAEFFSPHSYQLFLYPNGQSFDLEGLKGRWLSSSYAPKPGEPHYEPAMAGLEQLFTDYAADGRVQFTYETRMYTGQLL